ncbi:MAG: FkbM family methyltransferase [Methanobacterium sp.]|nr:FkbM family methyltransferase [Methanobacterium sp.]
MKYKVRTISERVTVDRSEGFLNALFDETGDVPEPRPVDKPLVLYGGGNLGKMAKEYLDFVGIPVLGVVDRRAVSLQGDPFWSGVWVVHPDNVPPEWKGRALLAVCIVTAPFTALVADLLSAGWGDVVPFYDVTEAYRDRHPLSNGWFLGLPGQAELSAMSRVMKAWADDISRAHFLQFLAWRRWRREWTFDQAPITTTDRYFIPEVLPFVAQSRTFLDVGAHHGEVAARFMATCPGFREAWLIEPDQGNLRKLKEWSSLLGGGARSKITIIDRPVSSGGGVKPFFSGGGYMSQLSPLGREKVLVDTIDHLDLAPSFIKLHLEGGELDALKGAQGTIAENRPLITLTVYHGVSGAWETPTWLREFFNHAAIRYDLYFRLHSWCGTGAVIYGIPR